MIKVLSIFGTRPEAIKFAPVLHEMAKNGKRIESVVCVTAQHREMLDQMLNIFKIEPDFDLNLMSDNQNLVQLTARALSALDSVIERVDPDWILIQGDTTTAMAASLVAFYHRKKIGHIEAGLRSFDKDSPFPEEINRRFSSLVADMHFAPTKEAKGALINEGISDARIFVTGNTVIDSLVFIRRHVLNQKSPSLAALQKKIAGRKMLLVTGHRRECFGKRLEDVCAALKDIVRNNDQVCIVFPVHPNPRVANSVHRKLGNLHNVFLIEPLPYSEFVWLMSNAYVIITDSGGIQEEAPFLGKPVLVTRDRTERTESIHSGSALLVGSDRKNIVSHVEALLTGEEAYQKMAVSRKTYGDGKAAERIVRILNAQAQ